MQTTCDSTLKFSSIVARWQGSAHDANIFRNSKLFYRFESGEFNNYVMLGDGGYPNKNYILTPLQNPVTPSEHLYNESQTRTRNCVERSYGVWKKRFPVLSLGTRLRFRKVQSIIVACAVLHNKCCIHNEIEVPGLQTAIGHIVDFVSSVPNNRELTNSQTNLVQKSLIKNYFYN